MNLRRITHETGNFNIQKCILIERKKTPISV